MVLFRPEHRQGGEKQRFVTVSPPTDKGSNVKRLAELQTRQTKYFAFVCQHICFVRFPYEYCIHQKLIWAAAKQPTSQSVKL